MTRCLIGLGSNLGDRGVLLAEAIEQLGRMSGIDIIAQSTLHETAPVGGPAGQPSFLNGALTLNSTLAPLDTLAVLRQIEQQSGRQRHVRWGARTLDLDLLLYGDAVLDLPELVVPHPRMSFRRFVLAPAIEVAADWQHPTIGWTLGELWRHLHDSPRSVVLVTDNEPFARNLAARVQEQLHDPTSTGDFELLIRPTSWDASSLKPRLIVSFDGEPRPGQGPVLSLRQTDLATAVQEVSAAVLAGVV